MRVTPGITYQLTVNASVVTLKDLHREFEKFPCRPNEEFVPSYYDNNLDKYFEINTDEALALMWGKHLGSREVLMTVNIVNKETGGETVVKDFTTSSTQTTQPSIHELIPLEYDADARD